MMNDDLKDLDYAAQKRWRAIRRWTWSVVIPVALLTFMVLALVTS